jgi:flavin reductase (DIM6/NTAB) family NADH-FMN oxidoreductase RutF
MNQLYQQHDRGKRHHRKCVGVAPSAMVIITVNKSDGDRAKRLAGQVDEAAIPTPN